MELIPCQCLQVSCPNLEWLYIRAANSMSAQCSHQLPTAYFSKLKALMVSSCGELRNLMSPSVARGLLNLLKLWIEDCQSMKEVITVEEKQGDEIMANEPLFPLLVELNLKNLPELGHFILTKHALKFPFLIEVQIYKCPKMKTFVQQGSVSTPKLKVSLPVLNTRGYESEMIVDDLNEWIHQRINSKVCLVALAGCMTD
ncbi:hypothetical protein T459_35387 [Capsicum annuum]|uniref:Disease resistance protein At4g27190-like leucine-rich repeats domain-containing protein n=2 Tax=Capsicum annuum TaxID=4072 RepID=A0A2G2XTG8_CAPAN|nr:hypothetical protein T459_35387 [Capsicum annuum]